MKLFTSAARAQRTAFLVTGARKRRARDVFSANPGLESKIVTEPPGDSEEMSGPRIYESCSWHPLNIAVLYPNDAEK
jgi:hypothetical protein